MAQVNYNMILINLVQMDFIRSMGLSGGDKMTTDNFNAIISAQIDHCESILCSKAKEYATADRLHNFKVAGALQGISPVQALMGMMTKHTVSVSDMCMSGGAYPQELWDEKITDSINYLLLLSALVREVNNVKASIVI